MCTYAFDTFVSSEAAPEVLWRLFRSRRCRAQHGSRRHRLRLSHGPGDSQKWCTKGLIYGDLSDWWFWTPLKNISKWEGLSHIWNGKWKMFEITNQFMDDHGWPMTYGYLWFMVIKMVMFFVICGDLQGTHGDVWWLEVICLIVWEWTILVGQEFGVIGILEGVGQEIERTERTHGKLTNRKRVFPHQKSNTM